MIIFFLEGCFKTSYEKTILCFPNMSKHNLGESWIHFTPTSNQHILWKMLVGSWKTSAIPFLLKEIPTFQGRQFVEKTIFASSHFRGNPNGPNSWPWPGSWFLIFFYRSSSLKLGEMIQFDSSLKIGGNDPIWLVHIFFRWVRSKPPTRYYTITGYSGQIITTKPPIGHLQWWFRKWESPQYPQNIQV